MWLVYVGVALLLAKLLGLGPFAAVSWWWVALPFGAAVVWWEVFERRLGLDKKEAFSEIEQARADRIARALEGKDAPRSRR